MRSRKVEKTKKTKTGSNEEKFAVNKELKQGCCLSPMLFKINIYLQPFVCGLRSNISRG